MKRSKIEEICKRLGMPLASDDDPRYSEPVSITMGHEPSPPSVVREGSRPSNISPEVLAYNRARLAELDVAVSNQRLVELAKANLAAAARDADRLERMRSIASSAVIAPSDFEFVLAAFREHFGKGVAGRAIFDLEAREVASLIVGSFVSGRIDRRLEGESTCLSTEGGAGEGDPLSGGFPRDSWEQVVYADGEEIEAALLSWSGLEDVWDRCADRGTRYALPWEYEFLADVVSSCSHIFVDCEVLDENAPGHGAVWHSVETDDPVLCRRELRGMLASLIVRWRSELKAISRPRHG